MRKPVLLLAFVLMAARNRTIAAEPAPELRTSGVGHDPRTTPSENVSAARMRFDLMAEFGGEPVGIIVDGHCDSCCRCVISPAGAGGGPAGPREILFDVAVFRFAKYGRAKIKNMDADWLIQMEDGEGLVGRMRVPEGDQGKPAFPGHLRLGGKMIVTMDVPGLERVRLRSRKEPIFEGSVPAWPPYGMVLQLTNGPIPYFREAELADPTAEPALVVTSNTVTLDTEVSPFLNVKPRIVRTEVVDPNGQPWQAGPVGGVGLEWSSESEEPAVSQCSEVAFYHIYRNPTPGDLRGWSLVDSLPLARHRLIDTDYDGNSPVEYVVMHAARSPFGYKYEGLYETPTVIQPVLSGGQQQPLDCNQDRTVDVSDAVCLLGFLFLGSPERLPCGDGGGKHASNVALLDSNGDQALDISDASAFLAFLFFGAAAPPQCTGPATGPCNICKPIPGCPEVCAH